MGMGGAQQGSMRRGRSARWVQPCVPESSELARQAAAPAFVATKRLPGGPLTVAVQKPTSSIHAHIGTAWTACIRA